LTKAKVRKKEEDQIPNEAFKEDFRKGLIWKREMSSPFLKRAYYFASFFKGVLV